MSTSGAQLSVDVRCAGALIAFAVVGHAVRPAVAGTIRGVQLAAHRARAAFAARYRL